MVVVSTLVSSPLIRPISVADRRIGGDGIYVFVGRDGFAGQHRLLHAQAFGCDQPKVGGHLVACVQKHDVSRHQFLGRHRCPAPVTQNARVRCQHIADCRQRLFGAALLHKADYCVNQHDRQDHAGIDQMPKRGRDNGCGQQHIDQNIVELPEEPAQRPVGCSFRQPVWPGSAKPVRGLIGAQPIQTRVNTFENLALCERMPLKVRRAAAIVLDRWGNLGVIAGSVVHLFSPRLASFQPGLRVACPGVVREDLFSMRGSSRAFTSMKSYPSL